MPADNSARLADAAKQRHELTRSKAIRAIRELAEGSAPITFRSVADHAEVSRSWLYAQPDIKAEIHSLRDRPTPPQTTRAPARQRGSDASLRRRLEIANQRIRDLTADNQRLRQHLEQALGRNRADKPKIAVE